MPGRLYNSASNTVPASPSSTAAAVGTSNTYARGNHVHPSFGTLPADQGFLAWNFDISDGSTSFILPTAGTIVTMKVNVPAPILVTYINLFLSVSGVTLTAGQNFVALYNSSKALIDVSADQEATFEAAAGLKAIALTTPQSIPAGTYYVGVWANGSTMPSFRSKSNLASANANLSAATSRWATADTGITTTSPATLGTFTAVAGTPWVAFT